MLRPIEIDVHGLRSLRRTIEGTFCWSRYGFRGEYLLTLYEVLGFPDEVGASGERSRDGERGGVSLLFRPLGLECVWWYRC